MTILVRHGREADAPAAIAVVRRSITELCTADHHGDKQALANWLANKTEMDWNVWVARTDATTLVAEEADEIIGIGMMDHQGEVLLNYVRPDARFRGVSKTLLAALEDEARVKGVRRCYLESTSTAKSFYEGCGYRPVTQDSRNLEKLL